MSDLPEKKDRDEHGRFVKGNQIENPNRGRPSRRDNVQFLIAVTENAYTPDELTLMLQDTWNMAVKNDNEKIMLEVLRFILAYAVGKPVSKSITAQVDPDEIRGYLRGLAKDNSGGDDDNDDVIEVQAN
jgi:hypothetical protein